MIRPTTDTLSNSIVKLVVQPALMAFLVWALGIGTPLASETILLCAFPTAVVPAIIALQYKT